MGAATQVSSERKRVMVVDDDRDARLILEEFLSAYGYEIAVCKGGSEAISQLRSPSRFDAVVLDLRMPGCTGYDVIRELRTGRPEQRDLPVIVVSAVADTFWGKAAAVFPKPVPLMDLLTKLDEVVGMHHSFAANDPALKNRQ